MEAGRKRTDHHQAACMDSPVGTVGMNSFRPANSPKLAEAKGYLTCLLTSFVISNIVTFDLPPKTALSASSALI